MTSTAPAVPPAARFAGLDGLRAIAVTLVVVYHLFPSGLLPGGFVGVDVFFVISGFLITSLLLREHHATGRIALGRFWQRRARRLLPALALVVAVCSTLAWIVGGDVLVRLGAQVLGAATFSYNWVSVAGGEAYFTASAPELFRNFWSLAVEEQFYLLWPLALPLLLLVPRVRARTALTLGLATASAIWMWVVVAGTDDPTRAYFGTDTHAFGLLLGVALAFALPPLLRRPFAVSPLARHVAGGAGVLAIGGIVVVASSSPQDGIATFPGALLVASVLSAVVIVAGVWPGSWLGRGIDAAPLRWVGDRSYSLYLWHWPLLVLALAALAPDAGIGAVPLWLGLGVLAAAGAASALSHRFVEMPVRRLGFRATARLLRRRLRAGPRARLRAVGVALAGVLVLAGTGAALAAAPDESSAEAAVDAGREALAHAMRERPPAPVAPTPPSERTTDASAPADARHEVPGDQITAVGDSVMLASAGGLVERLPGIDVDAEVSRSMWAGPGILEALAAGDRLRPYVVVALGTNGPVDPDALERIADTVGPKRGLVLVNAHAPRDWIPGVNAELAAFADAHRNVIVADWSGAIAAHEDLLADDRIHPGDAGGRVFADAVAAAVDELARERRAYANDLIRGLQLDLTP